MASYWAKSNRQRRVCFGRQKFNEFYNLAKQILCILGCSLLPHDATCKKTIEGAGRREDTIRQKTPEDVRRRPKTPEIPRSFPNTPEGAETSQTTPADAKTPEDKRRREDTRWRLKTARRHQKTKDDTMTPDDAKTWGDVRRREKTLKTGRQGWRKKTRRRQKVHIFRVLRRLRVFSCL